MTIHLVKLCVGCDSIEDLASWQAGRLKQMKADGIKPELFHRTFQSPKRRDELLDGGSLYWVIKGQVQARQRLLGIETFTDAEGISRCRLMLGPEVIETAVQPKRPFQGWRYLEPKDAPADFKKGKKAGSLPPEFLAELAGLGLR
jgi:hypothetical protein